LWTIAVLSLPPVLVPLVTLGFAVAGRWGEVVGDAQAAGRARWGWIRELAQMALAELLLLTPPLTTWILWQLER
ncbi:MAG: hypothetical protein M3281_00715, partial [Chloroflexota bacterium]|nr:hypothetical protein [Chloroflexota bacterium]